MPTKDWSVQERLFAWLQSHGYEWLTGACVGDDENWPPEVSVLVLDTIEAVADELCVVFEQNAALVNGQDAIPRLRLHPDATT